jgi:hypothetical protein
MPGTIIRFLDRQDQPGMWFFLAKPNGDPTFREFHGDPGQPPYAALLQPTVQPGEVGTAGLALYEELLKHSAVANHFKEVFRDTATNPPRPIGMQVDSALADSLPWETLCKQKGDFLALDQRWPVVRMLEPTDDRLRQDYEYVAPLKIAAVLSAWGSAPERRIGAKEEWKALEQSIVKNPTASASHLLVLVCEASLKQEIDQAAYPNVEVQLITDQNQTSRLVRAFKPHILHFFCHGHSGEKSYLRLNTAFDQASNSDGSIYLLPGDLRQDIDAEESAWLVVLNCCDGALATQSGDTRNLAASLVKAGFPAVIGMREAVDSNCARLLTQELYMELLPGLAALPDGQVSPIEWAALLVSGRKRLRNDNAPLDAGVDAATSTKQWAIPALYMRTLPFRMRKLQPRLADVDRQRVIAKLGELRDQRNSAMQMPLPAAIKQQMLGEFDQLIRVEEGKLL